MRFEITLNRTGKQKMLPMDYQYYLSAWIYKVISNADREFANFLHTSGYTTGSKQFKLFSYSPLDFGKPVLWKEKALFEIAVEQVYLKVSFHLADAAEKFIIGLFNNQQVYLGDKFNGLELVVRQIERLPEPDFAPTMFYRAISPVVVSQKEEGSKYARYLSPADEGYSDLLLQNLLNKYQAVPGAPSINSNLNLSFEVQSTPRSKLVTVKPYTSEQSKIRGFVYDFSLTGPVEIHRFVLDTQIGEKNSTGFGWVEPVSN